MASTRHHAEWLSLVEVSGPFLTMPVLERVFPQGLDAHEPEHVRNLRVAFDEWETSQTGHHPKPAIHKAWIDYVLKQTLGLPDEVIAVDQAIPQTLKATISEHGETLRPQIVVRNPKDAANAEKPRLLVQFFPCEQDLEKPVAGRHWKASPATRMMELLHATDTRLGLVTNGEHWMLVDAPRGNTTGFASWYATLWFEEPLTLRAFRSLLGVRRFFSVADDETLEEMFKESANYQNEVTDQLGLQVRHAVEVLIQSLDRADQDDKVLADVSETVLYEAALTVMMRLVFLFSAEERGLLLLGDPLFDQHYAVSTLVTQLQEAADLHDESVLERRKDAWVRLLSTFRAVFGGVQHERMKLPAYAGNLFNPDRFPFLEGRKAGTSWHTTPANPLPVNNRTVLHLLRSLQYLEMQGESRRLSFRALDIEQIGHVYEGLLDHTAKRATEPMLGLLGAKGNEPEVALSELERLHNKGEADLLNFLNEETSRQEKSLKRGIETPLDGDDAKKLKAACGTDEKLFARVRPFSGLLRNDTFDRPVVIRQKSVFVTAGTDRRSSGTHYTPRSLTEPIVQYTLEPLVYVGPAEGKTKEEWKLRPAKELLDLKVCDMACGSGAFLVQGCRFLSERLVEAWEDAEKRHPGVPGITPEGDASTGAAGELLIPKETNERLVYARRIVAQRCLYGVDKNPLAAEMAKLSLWLLTLAKDKPFTFLDHAIRCGDSLVGIKSLDQINHFNLDPQEAERGLFTGPILELVNDAVELRKKLEALPVNSVEDVQIKEKLLAEAEEKTARLRYAADLLISVEFTPPDSAGEKEDLHNHRAIEAGHYVKNETLDEFRETARKALDGQPTFHWPLEFPEVILDRGGFDAFVCNPPFMGAKKITGNLGTSYRTALIERIAFGMAGHADLCVYFILRAHSLLNSHGLLGFLATNTVAQGESREIGLDQLIRRNAAIPRATPSQKWPGNATVEVALVWICMGRWTGTFILNETPVAGIDAYLSIASGAGGDAEPLVLADNRQKAFQGSNIRGVGFILDPSEAAALIKADSKNKDVLFPYLIGQDINSRPDQTPSRWVINFFDWDRRRASAYSEPFRIVKEKVLPERMKIVHEASRKKGVDYFWHYDSLGKSLYHTIAPLKHVLARSRVSNTHAITRVPTGLVFSDATVVFAFDDFAAFAILQGFAHLHWLERFSSTMRTDTRYTPSSCFDTFPFPATYRHRQSDLVSAMERAGSNYYNHRLNIMQAEEIGLTQLYNALNSSSEDSPAFNRLRDLHVEMDEAVAAAYGWTDLNLGHDFQKIKQAVRFSISESARRELLARLLKLNHERYADEVAQGLHEKNSNAKKGSGTRGRKPKAASDGPVLFGGDDEEPDPAADADRADEGTELTRARRTHKTAGADDEAANRPPPVEEIETDDIMAAFRQAARGRGCLERDELLKEVSLGLGYQRLGSKVEETLRGQLRAAIRRRIIEADGAGLVRAATGSLADYTLEELRVAFRSVMQKGMSYERDDVIHALARHFGFARVTDNSRDALKSAINSAIRHGVLGYEGSVVWREE